jgi:gliding motility-associated lipoprotein GldH
MRKVFLFALAILLGACDDTRVYEQYHDFDGQFWRVSDKPKFEFVIDDPQTKYNIYGNVRNAVSYPWSRFFMTYYLQDSSGAVMKKNLMNEFLFDTKSGEPFGKSGLGDVYDHQFLLLKDFQFPYKGKYSIAFEHFMRTDSLDGVLAVGLRVEKAK